jgi:phospholipase A1
MLGTLGSTSAAARGSAVLVALAAQVALADTPPPSHGEPASTATEVGQARSGAAKVPDEDGDPWNRFTMYRPNYFITGIGDLGAEDLHPDVKFQISLRYELLTDPPGRWHVLLAYSQKSFWNIYDSSAPFRENNYNPEAFVQWHPRGAPSHYLKAGYAHESNGMGGAASRSWDRGFAEARISWGALTLYPVIWWPFRLTENPRILRSFGWGELIARLRLSANCELEAIGRAGSRFDRGSLLAGLNVGSLLQLVGMTEQKWFTPHFYLQLWHGFGESLIDYDVSSTALRLGLVLRP